MLSSHHLWRWNRRRVPKRRHIKFRPRGITQKKGYNTCEINSSKNIYRSSEHLMTLGQLDITHDLGLPPWNRWELRSSGLLRRELWQFLTDVAGQPFSPTFRSFFFFFNSWPLKMGPICCPETSVRNNYCSLYNDAEERSFHGHYAIFIGLGSIHYYKIG